MTLQESDARVSRFASASSWRAVLVINSLARGGAETQLVRLAVHLAATGHHVTVATLMPDNDFAAELEPAGVEVVSLTAGRRPRAVPTVVGLTRLLRRERADVAVSFLYQANVVTRVAAKSAGVPVVVSSIRNEYFGGHGRELAVRGTGRLASLTTTNSVLSADSLVRRGVVARDRLMVIPNALPPAAFDPGGGGAAVRSELGVAADEFLWLGVGRLAVQKAWPDLLRAFASVEGGRVPGRLVVAGEGPEADALAATVDRLDLSGRVRLLGVRRDVADLMAAADALVLPSAYEGLPNVVLEAMAAGLPVVATRVGGVPELVDDSVGIVVTPGSPADLAAAMRRMASLDVSTRARMGQTARLRARDGFSQDVVMACWLSVLDGLVARSGTGRRPRRCR